MLVLTLIANPEKRDLSSSEVGAICMALKATSVDWLAKGCACDIALPQTLEANAAREIVKLLVASKPIDFAIQDAASRRKSVLVADMDSTMIEQECIDELAAEAGIAEQVSAVTKRAMNGEIEFEAAVRERVIYLKGLPHNIATKVIEERITFSSGGKILVETMKANGAYTALISGGFTSFTGPIGKTLGFHEHHANILAIAENVLTGEVEEPILGAEAKVSQMHRISAEKKIGIEDFIAVGDGANDIPMLKLAGTGVALHAKPNVAAQIDLTVDHGDLTSLLYLQGYRETDFVHG